MRQKINPLLGILMAATLGLAACGPIQAREGQIYMAGPDGAKVTTVINMTKLVTCDVPAYTFAFAKREAHLDASEGSQGWDRTLLTQVDHNGPGCSPGSSYDFIDKKPEDEGWVLIKKPETLELAREILCAKSNLRELNPKLDEMCNDNGRKK